MPITHERLHRLCLAADHFFTRLELIRHTMSSQTLKIARGELSIDQAYKDLTMIIDLPHRDDLHHGMTYTQELTRYNLTHARNAQERLRMARKRAAAQAFGARLPAAIQAAKSTPPLSVPIPPDDSIDGVQFGVKPSTPQPSAPEKPPSDEPLSDPEFYDAHFAEFKALQDKGISIEYAWIEVRAAHKPPQE